MDIIEWAKSQTKGGSFLAFPNCTSLPENDLYFAGTLFVNAKGDTWSISAICVTTGITYTNASSSAGSVWTGWKPLATATPPQEFDLPLAEGYTQNNGCKYSKDQFNVVRVTFNLSKSAGTIAGGEVVATLPAGFRPKRYWACVAIGNNIPSDAATRHPVVVQVATNGEISASMMVETDQAELRDIVCAMEFLAAD